MLQHNIIIFSIYFILCSATILKPAYSCYASVAGMVVGTIVYIVTHKSLENTIFCLFVSGVKIDLPSVYMAAYTHNQILGG